MSYIYLIAPYSSDDPAVVEDRMKKVNAETARLMKAGFFVLSPLSMFHTVAQENDLPTDWQYWKDTCHVFIKHAIAVYVLKLEGWDESVGVQHEIEYARWRGLPVYSSEDTIGRIWDIKSTD